MKRGGVALAVALSALFTVAFAAAYALLGPRKSELENYSCDFPEGDPGAPGGGAVEIWNGEVQSVKVETYFPGLPGNLGYRCLLHATKGDHESSWKTDGLETTVDFIGGTVCRDGDYARLAPISGGYRIDLKNTKSSSEKCGAGAALPREIVIIGTGRQCRTSWNSNE